MSPESFTSRPSTDLYYTVFYIYRSQRMEETLIELNIIIQVYHVSLGNVSAVVICCYKKERKY